MSSFRNASVTYSSAAFLGSSNSQTMGKLWEHAIAAAGSFAPYKCTLARAEDEARFHSSTISLVEATEIFHANWFALQPEKVCLASFKSPPQRPPPKLHAGSG